MLLKRDILYLGSIAVAKMTYVFSYQVADEFSKRKIGGLTSHRTLIRRKVQFPLMFLSFALY